MIVVINGFPQSGKDQFISFCQESVQYVHNISTIDSTKKIATLMGWDGTKDNKSRDFLSDLKSLWVRYNNGPLIELAKTYMDIVNNEPDSVVFVHCREPEEISKIVDWFSKGAVYTLFLDRAVENLPANKSDTNVELYSYDETLANNGTLEELRDKAYKFIRDLKNR
jgi:hypothetical protein